jgi:hypothetical protein
MRRLMFLKQWHLLRLRLKSLISRKTMLPREMFPGLLALPVMQTELLPLHSMNYVF